MHCRAGVLASRATDRLSPAVRVGKSRLRILKHCLNSSIQSTPSKESSGVSARWHTSLVDDAHRHSSQGMAGIECGLDFAQLEAG